MYVVAAHCHHPARKSVVFLITELMYVEFFKHRIDKHDIEAISNFEYADDIRFEDMVMTVRLKIIDIFRLHV